MKLYHVSLGWKETPKLFIPRVPKNRAENENETIKRICLSTDIIGCLTAMPDKPHKYNTKITVYECDVHDYIDYNELYFSNKVCDSYLTHECWYLKPITMTGKHLILKSFESDWVFIAEEDKKKRCIQEAVFYLTKHGVTIHNKIIKKLYEYPFSVSLEQILPELFYDNDLDMDDVFSGLLDSVRTFSNIELV